jgi:hypothetical protein
MGGLSSGSYGLVSSAPAEATAGIPNAIQGVPQMFLSNPFPSTNPITPATRNSLGANTGLGDRVSFANLKRPYQHSDRYNFSVQRELPTEIVLDVTYFLNFTNQLCSSNYCFTSANLDMMDPRLSYQYGNALNQVVNNPFITSGVSTRSQAPCRYQPQVTIGSLMVPIRNTRALPRWMEPMALTCTINRCKSSRRSGLARVTLSWRATNITGSETRFTTIRWLSI